MLDRWVPLAAAGLRQGEAQERLDSKKERKKESAAKLRAADRRHGSVFEHRHPSSSLCDTLGQGRMGEE